MTAFALLIVLFGLGLALASSQRLPAPAARVTPRGHRSLKEALAELGDIERCEFLDELAARQVRWGALRSRDPKQQQG